MLFIITCIYSISSDSISFLLNLAGGISVLDREAEGLGGGTDCVSLGDWLDIILSIAPKITQQQGQ